MTNRGYVAKITTYQSSFQRVFTQPRPGGDIAASQQPNPRRLFDHLVGAAEQRDWEGEAKRLGVLMLMTSSNVVGCSTGRSPALASLRKSLSRKFHTFGSGPMGFGRQQ